MIGRRLSSYEITARLGEGGMGEVYRARDVRLGRDVALKVLPPDVTRDAGRLERFDREARAIAALNHPHIVTIYSTEEVDGIRFLTMELVEGETLSDLVTPGGLSVARFLDIAVPLADALTAAHDKHITHRDLKPGNVMVSRDGRVKVLDFGLARIGGGETLGHSVAATLAPVTQHGTIVGTMPYMSPEQVEGAPVDARSDLFSLGIIFYELLTGERPFQAASSAALMSAILRDNPVEIASRRADVPDPLLRLVRRCLEKRPEDRVQTARDVYNELRHLQRQSESSASRASGVGSVLPVGLGRTLSVAVLPFGVHGVDTDAEVIATGLTEDITASLAKFAGLTVVASQSARAYKGSPLDARQIAERLNARYILSGNVRKAGAALRVTAHVVDAVSAATLWSEHYDRRLSSGDLFEVQDDVTDHIVGTVGDQNGVLVQSMVVAVRQQPAIARSTSDDLVLRTWGFQHTPTAAAHAELRDGYEAHLRTEPDNPQLWAMLAHLYMVEHSLLFNRRPDPLERAQRAARRAIELNSANQQGWETLAMTCFYLGDRAGLEEASQRAIRINPRNAHTMAWMGAMWGKAGEYDRGCALVERAMQINPAHPGWLHFTIFDRHFARGEFADALSAARRVNIPDFMWMHFAVAAAAGHLGLARDARSAYDAMVRLAPPLAETAKLREFVTLWYWQPGMIESLLAGVAAAATAVTDSSGSIGNARVSSSATSAATLRPASDTSAPAGHNSISITPFTARGGDEAAALAEGLTEDVVTGLARFGNLKVLARHARYALEGSVRQAGRAIRVTARVLDITTGATVWAETYDREAAGSVFALQDDVTGRIVSTVADPTGVLGATIAAATADRSYDSLTVDELVVRFHAWTAHLQSDEHARLRTALERALELEPKNAEGWACLAQLYGQEHTMQANQLPDSLNRERQATQRAVDLNPQSPWAWLALGRSHLFLRDLTAARGALDRAVGLNPLNGDLLAYCALFLSNCGDYERGLELMHRARTLKPHHQGWYYFSIFNALYARGDDEGALRTAKQINMPTLPQANLSAVAAAGQLGRADEVRAPLEALRQVAPHLLEPEAARAAWEVWLWNNPALLDRLVDGLRKSLALA
jgi:TolB-like protein/cytochrome c-type biogenesis protein CcmH/NrfG